MSRKAINSTTLLLLSRLADNETAVIRELFLGLAYVTLLFNPYTGNRPLGFGGFCVTLRCGSMLTFPNNILSGSQPVHWHHLMLALLNSFLPLALLRIAGAFS